MCSDEIQTRVLAAEASGPWRRRGRMSASGRWVAASGRNFFFPDVAISTP